MGRMDITLLRYLTNNDFRLLTAVEVGMKNHELVPTQLVASLAKVKGVGIARRLRDLSQHKLLAYERGRNYDGYRLTNLGYDYLALRVLSKRGSITGVAQQIGVGKESDIYIASNEHGDELVLKFHRLGRTSFRKIKEKRDYHKKRSAPSWIYLSRLSALKEYAFMKALHSRDFAVPEPIDNCRHCIVMRLVRGVPLAQVHEVRDAAVLYDQLVSMVVRLAEHGLIHSDFNEFNIMLDTETEMPVMIDFPQMISTSHANAADYFARDVQCVREFCRKRFNFDAQEWPSFEEIVKESSLDEEVAASGYTSEMQKRWEKANRSDSEGTDEEEDNVLEEFDEEGDTEEATTRNEDEEITHLDAWMRHLRVPEKTIDNASADTEPARLTEELSRENATAAAPSTVASTIPPEVIRERVQRQMRKKQVASTSKPKIKGQASAVRRGRKDNKQTIREYDGWDDYKD